MSLLENLRSRLLQMLDEKGSTAIPVVLDEIERSNLQFDRPTLANLRQAGIEPLGLLQQGEYITRIKLFLGTLKGEAGPPRYYNIPIKPVFFIGRENQLKDIHKRLTDTSQRQNILLLGGIGGMGKTTLMQEYLHQHQCKTHFNRITFIAIDKNLEDAFVSGVSLALDLEARRIVLKNLPDQQLKLIVNEMKACKGNNLCVIDNVTHSDIEDLRKMRSVFANTGWKFLVTTRTVPDGFTPLDVDELDMEDASLLFAYHYAPSHVDTSDPEERNHRLREYIAAAGIKDGLHLLLTHIVRHTLLTELLAKAAKNKGLSVMQVLSGLKEQDYSHPDLQRIIFVGGHATSTFREQLSTATLHVYLLSLFDTEYLIKKTGHEAIDKEHEAIATMLRFFSLLPSTDIPVGDLKILWGVEKQEENSFEDRLNEIKQIGWISGKQEILPVQNMVQNLAYKMHPLVQEVVYKKLTPDIDNCRPLVKTLTKKLSEPLQKPQSYQNYADSIIDKLKLLTK